MILLVDNYDSFSYNLYQLAGSINPDMKVIRNDEMTIDEICALAPASIILSPGPGRPEQAGRCMEIVEKLGGEIPILGVCLGHQAICAAYGATVTYAKQLMHGKQSETTLDLTSELFQGLCLEDLETQTCHGKLQKKLMSVQNSGSLIIALKVPLKYIRKTQVIFYPQWTYHCQWDLIRTEPILVK